MVASVTPVLNTDCAGAEVTTPNKPGLDARLQVSFPMVNPCMFVIQTGIFHTVFNPKQRLRIRANGWQ
jgi:hypothetical protein